MNFHEDLLAQARHLLRKEPRRPKQASLRRAMSTAYYALFHLLVHESAKRLVSGAAHARLRALTSRAFEHATMRRASRAFASGGLPPDLRQMLPRGAPPALREIAKAFLDLQEARHSADYDLTLRWTRREAQEIVVQVEDAFQLWHTVRGAPTTRVYLTSLLLWRQWSR